MFHEIQLHGVGFTYVDGVQALRNVSTVFRRNEFVGVVGANGSGKSTLAYLLQGRFIPTTGSLCVDGIELRGKQPDVADAVVMVGSDPDSQLIATSVFDEVAFALRAALLPADEVIVRTLDAIERCGLRSVAKRHPGTLSAGEKARVLMAAALVRRPDWLVLDEVGSMLDSQQWHGLISRALDLRVECGMGLILITHRLEDLLDADRVLVLTGGELVMDGKVEEVFTRASAESEWHITLPLTVRVSAVVRSAPIRAILDAQSRRATVGVRAHEA